MHETRCSLDPLELLLGRGPERVGEEIAPRINLTVHGLSLLTKLRHHLVHPGLDRSRRGHSEHVCDLPVAQAGDAQVKDLPDKRRGQAGDGALERDPHLFVGERLVARPRPRGVRRVGTRRAPRSLDPPVPWLVALRATSASARAAVEAPGPVDDEVSRDSIDPRPESLRLLERGRVGALRSRSRTSSWNRSSASARSRDVTHDETEERCLVARVERSPPPPPPPPSPLLRLRVQRPRRPGARGSAGVFRATWGSYREDTGVGEGSPERDRAPSAEKRAPGHAKTGAMAERPPTYTRAEMDATLKRAIERQQAKSEEIGARGPGRRGRRGLASLGRRSRPPPATSARRKPSASRRSRARVEKGSAVTRRPRKPGARHAPTVAQERAMTHPRPEPVLRLSRAGRQTGADWWIWPVFGMGDFARRPRRRARSSGRTAAGPLRPSAPPRDGARRRARRAERVAEFELKVRDRSRRAHSRDRGRRRG